MMMSANLAQQPTTTLLQIPSEMQSLSEECSRLEERLAKMEELLRPVLVVESSGDTKNASTPEPVRVPLAGDLRATAQRISTANRQIESILNRLQL
jgi:hypothetical protein